MERATVDVYERHAGEWRRRRHPTGLERASAFARELPVGVIRADLGCGPGFHAGALGDPLVALDAARAMLELTRATSPTARLVQGDLEALPFADGTLGGAWASRSYLHVPRVRVPLALADLHRALGIDARVELMMLPNEVSAPDEGRRDDDDFPGRFFSGWEPEHLRDVLSGAGMAPLEIEHADQWLHVRARRGRMLPDTVGEGMRLLICGLNPSLYTADAGIGYARPGNRFWPAALGSGLVTRDRDPRAALREHGIGMTNLVVRATPRADQVSRAEYRDGTARVERLVRWLRPRAVCIVGITGWRAAGFRGARLGVQPELFGGRPVYVMPNTSGLNAHAQLDDHVEHLRAALALSDSAGALRE